MAKRVQILGHDEAGANAFTGLVREVTFDVTNCDLRLHDGTTEGGKRVANVDNLGDVINELIENGDVVINTKNINTSPTDISQTTINDPTDLDENGNKIINWDVSEYPNATVNVDGNTFIANPTGAEEGRYYILTLVYVNANDVVTFGDNYRWTGIGGFPQLTRQAGTRDKLGFSYEVSMMRAISCVLDY